MKLGALFGAAASVCASAALAASPAALAIAAPGLQGKVRLEVSSPRISPGGEVPEAFTAYGQDISPPLAWRGTPAGTRSLAVIIEDPDAPTSTPFPHWMVWNIPPSATGVSQGAAPAGAQEGKLLVGKIGYMGPRPPPGPAHHYHFEVFALDQKLDLKSGADRSALIAAMKGHVLASGELVALFHKA